MQVYVGTYAKYNAGSLAGKWLDLEDYPDKSEFYAACAELHADESDPEFMFQDWEDIPQGMIGESWISEDVFELASMDESDRELFKVYRENIDRDGTFEQAQESFRGKYNSPEDFAEDFYGECYDLSTLPGGLQYHINWEGVARDMQYCGDVSFVEHEGETWVFWNN